MTARSLLSGWSLAWCCNAAIAVGIAFGEAARGHFWFTLFYTAIAELHLAQAGAVAEARELREEHERRREAAEAEVQARRRARLEALYGRGPK